MMSKIRKEQSELKISAGLLVGYILGGTINILAFNKTWDEAFSEKELIFGFVGIAISIFIILRLKRIKNKERTDI